MKIAVWHNLPSGGGKRALHDHVRGLAMRGHHVESWSPPTATLSYMPLSPYATEHVVPLDLPLAQPRSRIGRLLNSYHDVVAKVEAMKRHARLCAAEIDGKGFDLVLGNSCFLFASSFIARFVEVPTVQYIGEPFREFYEARSFADMTRLEWVAPLRPPPESRSPLSWKKRTGSLVRELVGVQAIRLQAREECINAHAFDRVLCNSRFSHESIMRIYGQDARVCYLGVDTDAFRPTGVVKDRYVIGLGSFEAKKGLDVAIRAVATIDPAMRPTLVWVGNSDNPRYTQGIKELATMLGVRFVMKTLVGQDELVDLLCRAAVMVYTSRLEPFGYAPLEANACGTAVVGIAEGGIRESIQQGINGSLVEADDTIGLGRAISLHVNDLDFARDEGLRARHHIISQWSVGSAVDRLEMHLVEVLQGQHQTGVRGVE